MRAIAALLWFTACAVAETDSSKSLFTAIRNDEIAAVRSLTAAGGVVNVRGERDTTPLMYASAYGSVEALKLLLGTGTDVNAKNAFGATALMMCIGEPEKVRLLIEHKADVNAASKTGRTALLLAALNNGSDRVVDMLLAAGADTHHADEGGLTFLIAASLGWNPRQVRVAIEKGADVNGKDRSGLTPLMNAASNGDVESVKLLIAKGADVNAISPKETFGKVKNGPIDLGGFSALMLASAYGPPNVVDALLRAGAKVNTRDIRGMQPLHFAVSTEAQNPEIVRLLLKAGADASAKTLTGESAVDWAAKFAKPNVMRLLPVVRTAETAARAIVASTEPRPLPRAAAVRSIELLQKVSNTFMNTGGCVACHVQNLNGLAASYARARGFNVDESGLKEQLAAAKASFAGARDRLLLRFDGGGGKDTTNYALLQLSAQRYEPDSITDAMVHNLVAQQLTDGRWHAGGVARAPMQDSDIVATALSLRSLKLFGWPGRRADLDRHTELAHVYLLGAKPVYNEEYAMQILGLKWAGDNESITGKLALRLAAQQRPDGGWAQNPNLQSDAYATGQTLFALAETGAIKATDPVYRRSVEYLLQTQHEDGTWLVKSRAPKLQPYFQSGFPYDHDQWISMAGTAWATIALTLAAEPDSVASR